MVDQHKRGVLRTLGVGGAAAMFQAAANRVDATAPSVLTEEGLFDLGSFRLECEDVLPGTKLAYKIHGSLNSDKTNAVLYLTQIGAQHGDVEWLIGPGKALDPREYFIVVCRRRSLRSRLEVHRE